MEFLKYLLTKSTRTCLVKPSNPLALNLNALPPRALTGVVNINKEIKSSYLGRSGNRPFAPAPLKYCSTRM